MDGSCKMSIKILLVTCLVFGVRTHEQRVSRSLISTKSGLEQTTRTLSEFYPGVRIRRQAPPFPSSARDNDHVIPRIDPPPPGSILTYDGKAISTSIGAYNIVPKTERRTPSINTNRPQYATYRGDLPPPIPDVIPRDLPQFKDNKSIGPNLPPGFRNK